jgi:phosphohistidine phosphatase SixA
MKNLIIVVIILFVFASCRQTYYIVRHAEKETADAAATMMKNDPPLTEAGKQRAGDLKEILKTKKIGYIFSTNYIRTRSTAEPTRAHFKLATETYNPMPDSAFISKLKSLKKNVLIVGHSNTVDDLVNKLCGQIKIPSDLPDSAYGNLFVVTKKGNTWYFENRKFGKPAL